ncbi:MAG: purine-nucleoside phosphorylase [Gemmatimonadaceae bacterium]
MTAYGSAAAHEAASAVRERIHVSPRVGIILGSGLGGIADAIESAVRIPYREIRGFPSSTVLGHAGELVAGTLAAVPVAALSGRFHMYEGHDARLAGFPVRVLHALGIGTLIVSNAAGSARTEMGPGTIMLISDHLNLMYRNPLIGVLEEGDIRFPDMSEPYDAELRALARAVARDQDVTLAEGVYAALPGPSYETRAEVRMLARLGADVVGMSTVPEVIIARARGVRVLGVSCVTNYACGLAVAPITHAEVIETTAGVAGRLQRVVREIVARLPR